MRSIRFPALDIPRTQRVRDTFLILLLPSHWRLSQGLRQIFDRDLNGQPQFPELPVYLDLLKLQTSETPSFCKAFNEWAPLGACRVTTSPFSGWGNSKVISTHKFNDQNFCLLAAGLALLLEPNAHCLLLLVTHPWCKMLHQQKITVQTGWEPRAKSCQEHWAAGEHSLALCSVFYQPKPEQWGCRFSLESQY